MSTRDLEYFNKMKEPARSIGYRVIVKGESYERIAENTDLSVDTVEKIAKDAMKRLLAMLEWEHEMDELDAVAEMKSEYIVTQENSK